MRSKTMEAEFLLSEPPEAMYYVGGGVEGSQVGCWVDGGCLGSSE